MARRSSTSYKKDTQDMIAVLFTRPLEAQRTRMLSGCKITKHLGLEPVPPPLSHCGKATHPGGVQMYVACVYVFHRSPTSGLVLEKAPWAHNFFAGFERFFPNA